MRRSGRRATRWSRWAIAAALIVVAVASLPFLISDRVGVLGRGHLHQRPRGAALLDRLAPARLRARSRARCAFGYPVGPQALVAVVATVTGASLVERVQRPAAGDPGADRADRARRADRDAAGAGGSRSRRSPACPTSPPRFSPRAPSRRRRWRCSCSPSRSASRRGAGEDGEGEREPAPWRRCSASALHPRGRHACSPSASRGSPGSRSASRSGWRSRALGGRSPVDWSRCATGVVSHKLILGCGAPGARDRSRRSRSRRRASSPRRSPTSRIRPGRLSSPVFPGEALGIWPEGDFRIVRGEVSGSLLARGVSARSPSRTASGLLLRRRQLALLAMLVAGGVVYVGARLVAEIHVEAKALAVIAPLVILVSLRALLAPGKHGQGRRSGSVVFVAAAWLDPAGAARRADRLRRPPARRSRSSRAEAEGEPVAFLGVDRFAGYYLRGTLARAPAGYVPEEVGARDNKKLGPGRGRRLRHARLRPARQVPLRDHHLRRLPVLARRRTSSGCPSRATTCSGAARATPRGEAASARAATPERGLQPGRDLRLRAGEPPSATAPRSVIPAPALAEYTEWTPPAPPEARVAGQERGFQAPGTATIELELPRAGRVRALAAVPLAGAARRVSFDGDRARRAARLARRHVPERRRARRLLAARARSTPTPGRTRSRSSPPSPAASPAPSTPAGSSGSATSPRRPVADPRDGRR